MVLIIKNIALLLIHIYNDQELQHVYLYMYFESAAKKAKVDVTDLSSA